MKLDVLVAVGSVSADSHRHVCEEPSGWVPINSRINNANGKRGTGGQRHDSIGSGSPGIKVENPPPWS